MKTKTVRGLFVTLLLLAITSVYAKSPDDQKAEQIYKGIVAAIAKVSGALENTNSTPQATSALNTFTNEFKRQKQILDNSSDEVQSAFLVNHGEELQLHIDVLKDTINDAATNGKFDEDNDAFIMAITSAGAELADDN